MTAAESLENPPPLSAGRLPSLDGLRAVAIALVLLAHLCGTRSFPLGPELFSRTGDFANLGVRIFFVLSGFLITFLLLAERAATGRISLKNFYLRRALRILPPAYAFILAIGVATLLGLQHVSLGGFLAAASYTINYYHTPVENWDLNHLWVLAVEGQFYLVWPLALCLAGRKRSLLAAGIFFLIGPCARLFSHGNWLGGRAFVTNADALAAGCLLACLWERLGRSQCYDRFRRSWAFLAVPLLVAAGCAWGGKLHSPLGASVLNVGIALCLDWCVRRHATLIGVLLNWRPIAAVGVLSYSLYLWQMPFLNRNSLHLLNAFPLNLILAFALAAASYFCLEKPFLKLRKHFSPKKLSSASPVALSPPAVDTPPAPPSP